MFLIYRIYFFSLISVYYTQPWQDVNIIYYRIPQSKNKSLKTESWEHQHEESVKKDEPFETNQNNVSFIVLVQLLVAIEIHDVLSCFQNEQ